MFFKLPARPEPWNLALQDVFHLPSFRSSHFVCCPVFLQLAQAWQEAEVAKSRAQQLQDQVEELQEKLSVQVAGNHGDVSLLSELETSLEAAVLGVSQEEVSISLLQLLLTWRSWRWLFMCSLYLGQYKSSLVQRKCKR